MIEILNGIKETIRYGDMSKFRLIHNEVNYNYPKHWHVGIEIIMPVQNDYTVYAGNETIHLDEQDIIFINTGIIHSLESPSYGKRIIIQFDLSLLYSVKEFDTTLFMLPLVFKISPQTHPDIYKNVHFYINEIVREYDSDNALKEAAIYSHLLQAYVIICRNEVFNKQKFENIKQTKTHEYIEKLLMTCDYINAHFTESLTLNEVSEIAGFSKFHFTRLFKQFTNMTFKNYLNHCRVLRAETLLMDSNLSIMEVAMSSGFNSISTFNRIFKSTNNCSPNSFRKKRLNSGLKNYDEAQWHGSE